MPRDYKSRSRRDRDEDENHGPSPMVWLFVGILIGLIISGIFYLRGQHNTPVTINHPLPAKHHKKKVDEDKPVKPEQKETPANAQNLQTQFDFYNVLPKQSNTASPSAVPPSSTTTSATTTVIPKSTTRTPSAPTPTTTSGKTALGYAVQIATMSKSDDADQLKAQLLLLGFDVNVTPAQKNGRTLERVWIGPFTNKNDALSTQKQLQQNQITSQLLKLAS